MTSEPSRTSRVYAVLPHMAQVEAGSPVMDRFRDLDPAAQADVATRAKLLLCSGVEPTQDLLEQIVRGAESDSASGRQDRAELAAAHMGRAQRAALASGEVVYYLLFGDRVKIGTTTNLAKRVTGVPHDRVLASEPGGRDLERARHAEFAGLRVKGEWFQYVEPLVSHVAQLGRTR